MKFKNIPADIKQNSLKEAQMEINDLIEKLENPQAKLEQSMNEYNRILQLNHYIHEQFKKRAFDIKKKSTKKIVKKKIKK